MSSSITLGKYLFTRLHQLHVESVHGVPGDYNLQLLDCVKPAGLRWVGNANELNAAYAADGYARIKGLGVVVTTFGVGELSAINGIAGAYAEFAPVVHIVGTPSRELQEAHALMHHTFNDGEYRRFAEMHRHVTVAQASLDDPRTCAEQIDTVLKQCLQHSRPVYLEVPQDMVTTPLSASRLASPIVTPRGGLGQLLDEASQEAALQQILARIYSAKQPMVVVDGETRPLGILDDVRAFVQATQWPTWTTSFGKDIIDGASANHYGLYAVGSADPDTRAFVKSADLVLFFGPHFSFSNSDQFTAVPKKDDDVAVLFTPRGVQVGKQNFRNAAAKHVLKRLVRDLDLTRIPSYCPLPTLPRNTVLSLPLSDGDQPITQDRLWRSLSGFLQPGDIIFGETGTAGLGVREMLLPPHARFFSPVTWLSIGYMLPAAQGAAMAQEELLRSSHGYFGLPSARTVLFIGDGSFQMTAQELGTIIRHQLNVVVFVINNAGYTIERAIHGRTEEYNDIAVWRYLQAPHFFGAKESTYTASAQTWRELKQVLDDDHYNEDRELRMVELLLDPEDCPDGLLKKLMESQPAQKE